jgi:hypothetical protein
VPIVRVLGAGAVLLLLLVQLAWWPADGWLGSVGALPAPPAPVIGLPASAGTREPRTSDLGGTAAGADHHRVAADAGCGADAPGGRMVRIVDPDGAPVAGATVAVDAGWFADGALHADLAVTTGKDGTATVPADTRLLSALAPRFLLATAAAPGDGAPWTLRLARGNRIELALRGGPAGGVHAVVRLPRDFRQETFYQQRYVQMPGRTVDGTVGRWTHLAERIDRGPAWSLALPPSGPAVLDQLGLAARATVTLRRFSRVLERREVVLPPSGGCTRLEFDAPRELPPLCGTVVDERGQPLAGADVGLAPQGGPTLVDGAEGFPCWAPRARTGADGAFALPRPDDVSELLVVRRQGHAGAVLTVGDLLAARGRVQLQRGRVVVVELVDRDGAVLDGGWSSGMDLVVRPRLHLGHDVWRGESPPDHPETAARDLPLPFFVFADLPAGRVQFRIPRLGEELAHDTALGHVRHVSRRRLDELMLGK